MSEPPADHSWDKLAEEEDCIIIVCDGNGTSGTLDGRNQKAAKCGHTIRIRKPDKMRVITCPMCRQSFWVAKGTPNLKDVE